MKPTRRALTRVATAVAIVVVLAACTDSSSRSPSSTPAAATKGLVAAATRNPPAASVQAPADGIPKGFGITDLSFVSSTVGWALGQVPCVVGKLGGSCSLLAQTKDGGRTWLAKPTPLRDCSNFGGTCLVGLAFATADVGYVFGAATTTQTAGIYLTRDGGASWTRQPTSAEAMAISGHTVVRVAPSPPDDCSYFCQPVIQRSSFGSTHWTTVRVPAAPLGRGTLTASGDQLTLFVDGRGGIGLFVSDDAGLTWVHRQNPCSRFESGAYLTQYSVGLGSTLLAACTSEDDTERILVSTDSGATFPHVSSLHLNHNEVAGTIAAFSADVLVLSDTDGVVRRSTDAGRTWLRVAANTTSNFLYTPETVNDRTGFMLAKDGTILLRTTDGGIRWQAIAVH